MGLARAACLRALHRQTRPVFDLLESSRTVCYTIKGTTSRFEIRADNSRFHNPFACLVRSLRTRGLCKSYRNFLSRCSFCLGGTPGLFFRDGHVIGLSGLSRSPWIPLWDKRGIVWSGNRGLRFGIGADYGVNSGVGRNPQA